MGKIRIVSPGKTCGYPYPVCKKLHLEQPYLLLSSAVGDTETVLTSIRLIL